MFEVERLLNPEHAKEWLMLGKLKAAGNSNSIKNYQFTDASVVLSSTKTIYYRLKIIDNDGSFTYSKIVSINLDEELMKDEIHVFPNPFSENVYVKIVSSSNQEVKITLRDITGKIISNELCEVKSGLTIRNEAAMGNLQIGMYFITVETRDKIQTRKLIKR